MTLDSRSNCETDEFLSAFEGGTKLEKPFHGGAGMNFRGIDRPRQHFGLAHLGAGIEGLLTGASQSKMKSLTLLPLLAAAHFVLVLDSVEGCPKHGVQ